METDRNDFSQNCCPTQKIIPPHQFKKRNYSGALIKTQFIVGVLFLLSGLGSYTKLNKEINFAIIGGMMLLLGGLSCLARRKEGRKKSLGWLLVEISSLITILIHVIPAVSKNLWYEHPLYFLFAPIFIFVCWLYVLLHPEKDESIATKNKAGNVSDEGGPGPPDSGGID